ncbi:hypothetical protein [Nocardia sp. NPDC057353]|uniref:hypothetical protein n=1 Tax=Nocardia sp. NPDC057353 TaxID=3346104 RepID=UPI00362C2613
MPIAAGARNTLRYVLIGFLVLVGISPLIGGGLIAWNQIRIRVDPPAEMRHATATDVSGFDEISLTKANLGSFQVTKVFLGPVIDRPQAHISAPGAVFTEKNKSNPARGMTWLVHGDYPDGCFVSVDKVAGGAALRGIDGLSDAQRDEVTRGEKIVLEMRFACGEG